MYSRKKTGTVNQSFTLTVADNKLIRAAAEIDRRSIRSWIVKTLLATAKRQVKKAKETGE